MTKQQYIRNQLITQGRLMKKYRKPVADALYSQYQEAIDLVNQYGVEYALNHVSRTFHVNNFLALTITSLYTEAATQAKRKFSVKADPATSGAFGINIDFINSVISYFKAYLLEKVVIPISQTTTDLIAKILNQAIQNGWGAERAVKELELDGAETSKWRSRMIVRTESVRAMNYSQLKAADDENYQVEKEWMAIEDNRTRFQRNGVPVPGGHNHLGVDGEKRGLYDTFGNGLLFPGDPNGAANQTINCRCTMGYSYKRDANGDLVPKKRNILQAV